jgi:predicted O-methyltransferase YrrM
MPTASCRHRQRRRPIAAGWTQKGAGCVDYLEFLAEIHRRMQPECYLEIGVSAGQSLALAQCRAVGVDPAYAITSPLEGDIALIRSSSDDFFATGDLARLTGGRSVDLAFIDGLHLFEFAFRDFINAERHAARNGIIIFDDVLPRDVDEAARERHTYHWTGDVYPMLAVLERYRPDLIVLPVGTMPTGLLLVLGLDPDSTVLSDNYDEIMAEFRRPDPQPVPPELLDRVTVLAPERILSSGLWDVFAGYDGDVAGFRRRLEDEVSASLGTAFVRDQVSST